MTTKLAFPTDEHHPFADRRAVALAQRIVHDYQPDILIRGSDALDFYSVSSYLRSKKVWNKGLEEEINSWKKAEAEWADVAPDADKPFLIGNHEDRLFRYVTKKAPELEWWVNLEKMLDFERFGLYLPKNNEVLVGKKLLVRHGSVVRKYSGYTAKAELEKEKYGISILTGHTHRGGTHYARTRSGFVVAHEGFCLCDLNPAYVTNPDWQHGIILATVNGAGVQIEPVPFFEKGSKLVAYWREKEYN